MTNEQLVIQIKAGINVADNMEKLWQQVHAFIRSIARKFHRPEEQEDLEQEGYIALCAAIDGYDPDAGCKFLTYAGYHIQNEMTRYILSRGSCLRIPERRVDDIRRYRKFCSTFYSVNGRDPSEGEAAALMGTSVEEVKNIRKYAHMVTMESLDRSLDTGEGESGNTLADVIASERDMENDVLEDLEQRQLQKAIWSAVDTLEPQQANLIRERYQKNMTLKAIGQKNGLTVNAVKHMEETALRELHKPSRARALRPFLPETLESDAYHGCGIRAFNRTWTASTERVALRLYDMKTAP